MITVEGVVGDSNHAFFLKQHSTFVPIGNFVGIILLLPSVAQLSVFFCVDFEYGWLNSSGGVNCVFCLHFWRCSSFDLT